jgi:hypothetical protein
MTRAVVVITSRAMRERVAAWAEKAPAGTRVEFKAPRRSLPQNDRLWAMLTDVSKQATHAGRKYTPDQWKVLFMHALDGSGFIPWGQSSSDLSKSEMTELIEFIFAWGAQHGVTFHDDKTEAA